MEIRVAHCSRLPSGSVMSIHNTDTTANLDENEVRMLELALSSFFRAHPHLQQVAILATPKEGS